MTRSVPMTKALDDAMIALYQNGERLRPAQGYPLRLFLPGYERQCEHQVAPATQSHGRTLDDAGGDVQIHGSAADRSVPAVYVLHGREISHHVTIRGPHLGRTPDCTKSPAWRGRLPAGYEPWKSRRMAVRRGPRRH